MRVWLWRARVLGDRFLSVRLGPRHRSVALDKEGLPDALVLEFESSQWVLYLLGASGKIIEAIFPGTLANAFDITQRDYGVAPDEWTEDFNS